MPLDEPEREIPPDNVYARQHWMWRVAEDPALLAAHLDTVETWLNSEPPTSPDYLKDSEISARCGCVERMGKTAQHVPQAIPLLIRALENERAYDANYGDPYGGYYGITIAETATGALRSLPEAIPALIEALKSVNPHVRCHAATALHGLGAAAKKALPTLRTLLKDRDDYARTAARFALEAIEEALATSSG